MLAEKHDTCLGTAPRKINKEEVKLTFRKCISEMLRQKAQNMGDP